MILQSLAGLPAFLVYFCTAIIAVVAYLAVYTRITPHNEFQLIRDNDPAAAIAAAFLEKPKELARMHRYVAAAQSAYYKAIVQLSKLQKDRAADEQIGFVSYDGLERLLEDESALPFLVANDESDRANRPGYADPSPTRQIKL